MDDRYALLADLAVRVGANVQAGQIVAVAGEPGKEDLARATAAAAYRAGAKFVDVQWFDPWIKRERVLHAAEDTLEYVPPWLGERMLALGEIGAARIAFAGVSGLEAMEGVDPVRAGRDQLPRLKESSIVLTKRQCNWTIVPCPTDEWARLVHPDLEPAQALEKLWEQILHICRLDTDDPAAAWAARADELDRAATRLSEQSFDALHYTGPGTDLTIGMLPGHRWISGGMETASGTPHMANLPTEEVFTSPDPLRVDGVVAATKPLVLIDGTVVRDLVVRFEDGRAVELTASSGQETMRTIIACDGGAARLGEVALVDNGGRIGPLDTVFYDTLLDENAASHIALGVGFPFAVPEEVAPRVNDSEIHIDFMIGSPDVTVTGFTADGERVPVLEREVWA